MRSLHREPLRSDVYTTIPNTRTRTRERSSWVSRETYSRDQCSDKSHLSIYMRMQITERERERERDVPPLSLSIVLIKNFITKKRHHGQSSDVCLHIHIVLEILTAKIFDFVITEIFWGGWAAQLELCIRNYHGGTALGTVRILHIFIIERFLKMFFWGRLRSASERFLLFISSDRCAPWFFYILSIWDERLCLKCMNMLDIFFYFFRRYEEDMGREWFFFLSVPSYRSVTILPFGSSLPYDF